MSTATTAWTLDKLSEALYPNACLVLPNLWVGDWTAGVRARTIESFDVLNVREEGVPRVGGIALAEGDGRVSETALARAVGWVADCWRMDGDRQVLVHCLAGADRSPLVIARFMSDRLGMDFDYAYLWVRVHRPGANDRRDWVTLP